MKRELIPIAAIMLSGCTTLPKLAEEDPEWVSALSNAIQCEVYTVFSNLPKEERAKFAKWGATYSITQSAEDGAAAGIAPLGWITPARVDKFLLSGSANASRRANRQGGAEFSVSVDANGDKACAETKGSRVKIDPKELKLKDWVEQVAKASATPNGFTYSVTIDAVGGVGVAPSFANGRAFIDGSLSYARATKKVVDFGFAGPKGKPEPLEVVIVERKRAGGAGTGTNGVSQSIIQQNRQAIQGLQLDRISPFGLLDR